VTPPSSCESANHRFLSGGARSAGKQTAGIKRDQTSADTFKVAARATTAEAESAGSRFVAGGGIVWKAARAGVSKKFLSRGNNYRRRLRLKKADPRVPLRSCSPDAPLRYSSTPAGSSQLGGFLSLAPGVSTVRYAIPDRIFDYVSTVRSATPATCQIRTL
jgi:hypothetical protein